ALSLDFHSVTGVAAANGMATFRNLVPVGAGVGFTLVAHLNAITVTSAPFRSVILSHIMPVVVAPEVFGPHPNGSATEAFVKGLYRVILGRDAVQTEWMYYGNQLNRGAPTP